MFPALMIAIFMGFPVAFSLMGVAVIFGYLRFGDALVHQLVAKVDDVASYYVLAAVPLFIFMGSMLERSGVAERFYRCHPVTCPSGPTRTSALRRRLAA